MISLDVVDRFDCVSILAIDHRPVGPAGSLDRPHVDGGRGRTRPPRRRRRRRPRSRASAGPRPVGRIDAESLGRQVHAGPPLRPGRRSRRRAVAPSAVDRLDDEEDAPSPRATLSPASRSSRRVGWSTAIRSTVLRSLVRAGRHEVDGRALVETDALLGELGGADLGAGEIGQHPDEAAGPPSRLTDPSDPVEGLLDAVRGESETPCHVHAGGDERVEGER